MLLEYKFSIGNHIVYIHNKEKFDVIANTIISFLQDRENEIKKYLLDEIHFINEEEFVDIKKNLVDLNKFISKLDESSENLFDIKLSELSEVLGYKYRDKLKELIISIHKVSLTIDGKPIN